MKLLKKMLTSLAFASLLLPLAFMSCEGVEEHGTGGWHAYDQGQSDDTGSTKKDGSELVGTLWLYDDVEIVTAGGSDYGSGSGSSGSSGSSGTGDGSSGSYEEGSGGEGSGSGSGESTMPVSSDRVYLHFIDDVYCIYGKYDGTWTPKFAGTWSVNGTSISFNLFCKAEMNNEIDATLHAWSNNAYGYQNDDPESIYSPIDYGIKQNGITYSMTPLKLSLSSSDESSATINRWNRNNSTNAAIDGLKVLKETNNRFMGKTFVSEDGEYYTFMGIKVFTGNLLKNTSEDFQGTFANVKNHVPANGGEATSLLSWISFDKYLAVSIEDSNNRGKETIAYWFTYDEKNNTLTMTGNSPTVYYGGKTIYAEPSDIKKESIYANNPPTVYALPDSVSYPDIEVWGINSIEGFDSSRVWCLQNASFVSEDESVKLTHAYDVYKKCKYTLTVNDKESSVSCVLPDRFVSLAQDYNAERIVWDVTDTGNGSITITSGDESYTLSYSGRTEAKEYSVTLTSFEGYYYTNTWNYRFEGAIDEANSLITVSITEGGDLSKVATSLVTIYGGDSYLFDGKEKSSDLYLKDGMKLSVTKGKAKKDYTIKFSSTPLSEES